MQFDWCLVLKYLVFHMGFLVSVYAIAIVSGQSIWDSLGNCEFAEDVCPNDNINFWLYRSEFPENPTLLNTFDLIEADFQPKRSLVILIHGYTGDKDYSPNSHIRPPLLSLGNVYVISPDYGPLVKEPCYPVAVANTPIVAKCIGQLINALVDADIVANEDIHVIGFSLGAQVAGMLSNYVTRPLKWITGLDPAKPLFVTATRAGKLDATDAEFVDVVHTDIFGRGMLEPLGHVDFYPNAGWNQPGCTKQNMTSAGSCNHDRAPMYYAESIRSTVGFYGFQCSYWFTYLFGFCSDGSAEQLMGYYVNKSARGSYFLITEPSSPFAISTKTK